MRRKCCVSMRVLAPMCLVVGLVLCTAALALAYGGGAHWWCGEQVTVPFRTAITDMTLIERHPYWPVFPELEELSMGYDPESSYEPGDPEDKTFIHLNHEWIKICSMKADDACVATLHHFWRVSDGLDDCPGGYDVYNSWEISQDIWKRAIDAWHAGDLGWAYESLGYAMHHVQDMLQPAHSNDDLHPSDDAIEEWFDQNASKALYSWDGSTGPEPPAKIPWPHPLLYTNEKLLADIQAVYCWDGCGEDDCSAKVSDELEQWQGVCLKDTNPYYNMQKYFYMLYWANKFGHWFASDDMDGNNNDSIGWLNGYPNFPASFAGGYSIHDQNGLLDNDDPCENGNPTGRCRNDQCDCDGDLSLIVEWCYGAAFKASTQLLDLFRHTVDHVAPVTEVEMSQEDGDPVVQAPEWNNSHITVSLVSAEDFSNGPGYRASGLWRIWGRCDTLCPSDFDAPSWHVWEDGHHKVQCMSVDMCGNVEDDHDILLWVDCTPPEVTFPNLRPNYLTSESFTATWEATDATSGIASVEAWFDGVPVTKGQVFDLSLMAGTHTLRVKATDNATNVMDVTYTIEVWINANSWAKPVYVADKTKGSAMVVVVEFPAPYDVGLIDLTTCTLSVMAGLDFAQTDPIVGETAVLQGDLLTGVGDHDKDGIPDRMIRFNKEQFVAAVGGQTGDIASVVSGGLLPNGNPQFIAVCMVPVFAPPPK